MYNSMEKRMIQMAEAVTAVRAGKEQRKRFRAYAEYVEAHVMKPLRKRLATNE